MIIPRTTLLILLLPAVAQAQPVDYMRDVKPILAASCYTCHGAIHQKRSLRLDTVALMKQGGDNGSILADNLILKHIRGDGGFPRMPPPADGEALKPAQIAIIQRWVEQGAVSPKDEKPEADPRDHWAFRGPVRPEVPKVKNAGWVRNPIDAFLAAEHEKHGLTPQGPAEHSVWLRRVYLDLIGVPPTREEQLEFLKDCATPQAADRAHEKVVDRLLASPQYGERWGRHWMDVWRYSDWWGLGAELRNSQRHIWHWRDWIVESLNNDKGYDQMLREMLAADELYPTDADALRGTGFLARHYFLFNRTTWLDETIEHTSKAFMGLTFNCCKCHDHKYDAFTQADYYRFRAIFEPYQIRNDMVPGEINVDKNGLPRVYDANLDVPTYLHIRGNEQQADKKRVLKPGLPSLLLPGGLQVKPIQLPAEAHNPGLRAFVLQDHMRVAEKQLKDGQDELKKAKATLAEKLSKEIDNFIFTVVSVKDTDNIEAKRKASDRNYTLRMANVVPFAQWPKDLTEEERKTKEKGLAFVTRRLKEGALDGKHVQITGIDDGQLIHGDLVLQFTGSLTPGAPSTLGWGIVHLNCELIEQGYSVFQTDPPEHALPNTEMGMPKKLREALYKDAEAWAIKNKTGIWKHEELAKKLKALSKQSSAVPKAKELARDDFSSINKERCAGKDRRRTRRPSPARRRSSRFRGPHEVRHARRRYLQVGRHQLRRRQGSRSDDLSHAARTVAHPGLLQERR
ncbi:MAG: DUF1549 domain-containing protein [Planctomycetes bacterium]|nr:DUF1549 domain-containing protein [Planctomycetota bacterium]